ncbi:ABC transporter substrate-binding protein [Alteromonas flava]|uniref:ABC transporter substrate-binding protein n=1 Tax=Alteromonas flava TaxID=2048003 RepID=UPI000C2851EE|nr:ABC transporter substrate-binding protein [Alteromonas flava]
MKSSDAVTNTDQTGQNSRRKFIKSATCAVASLGFSSKVFAIGQPKPTIRVLGTHVTLQEELRKQAREDLGIEIEFEPRGSAAVLQKASMLPQSFDLYEQWSNSIQLLWRTGAIQPIEKSRISYWDEINPLTKTGKLTPTARIGAGDAPFKIVNVDKLGQLTAEQTELASFLPYVHNVDSFGYNTQKIAQGIAYETESWGWLLEPKYQGKVAIVNDPTIGLFDLALAAQAKGLVQFNDIGNISNTELDALFGHLIEMKLDGHFSGFWTSVPESVEFMRSDRVRIESMFSPAVSALNGQGMSVRFAAPKEGYRGWHGVMCLSSATEGRVKDACYEYMNWWLSGWPGAFIARQGYYISNPQRSAKYLSTAEWDYWYDGKPASEALRGTDNKVSVQKGDIRTGGSYMTRLSNVAVWNTVMPSYEYSLQKWYELVSS